MVKGVERNLPKTILVAVDGSKQSLEAARYAMVLAKRMDAKVHIIHVVEVAGAAMVGPAGTGAWGQVLESMKESARTFVGLAVREAEDAKVPHTVDVVEAVDAAAGIAKAADDGRADLIVVGSHGRRGIQRALLGSVAEKVVRSAPCPVLVVR